MKIFFFTSTSLASSLASIGCPSTFALFLHINIALARPSLIIVTLYGHCDICFRLLSFKLILMPKNMQNVYSISAPLDALGIFYLNFEYFGKK